MLAFFFLRKRANTQKNISYIGEADKLKTNQKEERLNSWKKKENLLHC